jgi:hypothetical protein
VLGRSPADLATEFKGRDGAVMLSLFAKENRESNVLQIAVRAHGAKIVQPSVVELS